MKKTIHPKYYSDAKVICACGNTFTTGSTLPEIHTELCSKCHPFFTGTQKLVDTAHRVENFKQKLAKGESVAKISKGKKAKKEIRTKKANQKKTLSIKDIEQEIAAAQAAKEKTEVKKHTPKAKKERLAFLDGRSASKTA